jgi:hypothetical protein
MRLAALLAFALALSWPLSSRGDSPPSTQSQSAPRVESHDVPDDDDDEEEVPWTLYVVAGGFVFFAAVVYLVISRAGRSGKG